MSKLIARQVSVQFNENECKLSYKGVSVAIAEKIGNLYQLATTREQSLSTVHNHSEFCHHQWHRRLGHRDPIIIGFIEKKHLASGIKVVDCGIIEKYEPCLE